MSFSFSKPLALDILPSQQISLLASLAADGQPAPTFSFTPPDQIIHDCGKAAMMVEECLLFEPLLVIKPESFHLRGLHYTLQNIENHISSCRFRHPSLRDLVFRGCADGTTSMLLACHQGDLQWVKRLVDTYNVDINGPAVYYTTSHYEWTKFAIATPVFVAALNGHLDIVQYLVGKKADLSSKTISDNSSDDSLTPLQGAIRSRFKNQQNVTPLVRFLLESGADPSPFGPDGFPMWMRSFDSAEITTLLINHGMNLDERNSNGETMLHCWADLYYSSRRNKMNSMTIVELLVNRKADLIMARDDKGFTPVLTAVSCFNWDVVFFLLERDGLDRMDRIEALEMTATTILSTIDSQSYSASQLERALECWREASHLREVEPGPIPRTPLTLKSERTVEWITTVQLEHHIQDPPSSPSIIKTQLFLARLTICSGKSWRAVFSLWDSFENCVDYLKAQQSFEDLLDVLWATLETIHQFRSSGEEGLCLMVDKVIANLLMLFKDEFLEDGPHLNTETIKKMLEVLVATNSSRSYSGDTDIRRFHPMELLHEFVTLLASHPEIVDEDMKKLLWRLVAQDTRNQIKETLLHKACYYSKDLPTIRLLLLSGADSNADDHEGNGPLHVLAFENDDYRRVNSAAYYLLEYGACLEKQNKFGKTAADVWIDSNIREDVLSDEDELPEEDMVPEFPLPKMFHKPKTVSSLEILCARIIRSQRVPYNELPATLISMVELREELSEEVLNSFFE